MSHIRAAGPQDLPGTYRVCLQTADAGADGSGIYANPDLLGHIYVGPYIVGQPALAFVLADADGIAGYVLGAADTRTFESWLEREWWPVLRAQYPRGERSPNAAEAPNAGGRPDAANSPAARDDDLVEQLHSPETAPDSVVADYPAHLHIDLLPRAQGRGLGRVMLETLFAELRALDVPGIHLAVGEDNHNAIEFYRHLGFAELTREGDAVFMGRVLS